MLHGSTPPPTYAWAGFISATTRLTSTMSDMLTLKVVTRVVGYGKPEVLPQAGREYDDYLTCKTKADFEAWQKRHRSATMHHIMELAKTKMEMR